MKLLQTNLEAVPVIRIQQNLEEPAELLINRIQAMESAMKDMRQVEQALDIEWQEYCQELEDKIKQLEEFEFMYKGLCK
jgi:two-component sensor histidine kinase